MRSSGLLMHSKELGNVQSSVTKEKDGVNKPLQSIAQHESDGKEVVLRKFS